MSLVELRKWIAWLQMPLQATIWSFGVFAGVVVGGVLVWCGSSSLLGASYSQRCAVWFIARRKGARVQFTTPHLIFGGRRRLRLWAQVCLEIGGGGGGSATLGCVQYVSFLSFACSSAPLVHITPTPVPHTQAGRGLGWFRV